MRFLEPTYEQWRSVPDVVCAEYHRLRPFADLVRETCRPTESASVYWKNGSLYVDDPEDIDRACELAEILRLRFEKNAEVGSPPAEAISMRHGPGWLSGFGNVMGKLHYPFGGPSPLSTAIVGGLLTGGLGYGIGSIADRFAPEEHFDRQNRKRWGLLGALAGAVPGVASGLSLNMEDPGVPGKTIGQTSEGGWTVPYSQWFKKEKSGEFNPFDPSAMDSSMSVRSIPVDAFNQAVWNDVHAVPNPFGTKSSWGSNEQPMGTPAPVAATVSGLVVGAGAAANSPYVSPWDIATTAALSGAKGWVGATILGKTIGALAGLSQDTQKMVSRAGLFGGALSGAVQSAFGR